MLQLLSEQTENGAGPVITIDFGPLNQAFPVIIFGEGDFVGGATITIEKRFGGTGWIPSTTGKLTKTEDIVEYVMRGCEIRAVLSDAGVGTSVSAGVIQA